MAFPFGWVTGTAGLGENNGITLCTPYTNNSRDNGQCPHGVAMKLNNVPESLPPARSTYRHGDLRRALLDAGIELARGGGPEAVVLREATRRAGVVPNAAYRHFASRHDLLLAVRAAALSEAAKAMESELAVLPCDQPPARHARWRGVPAGALSEAARAMESELAVLPCDQPPADFARGQVRAIGTAYLRFAQAQPGLFRTAFVVSEEAQGDG